MSPSMLHSDVEPILHDMTRDRRATTIQKPWVTKLFFIDPPRPNTDYTARRDLSY